MIEVNESLWRSSETSYLRVLPEALKVRSRSCSLRLQRVLCDFGMEDSFARSVQRLSEHYGFEVSPSAVAKITLKHAAKMGSQSEQKPNCLPAKGKEQIVAEADGSFLRIVRFDGKDTSDKRKQRKVDYREVRLCAASAHESNEVRYAATFEDVDQVSHWWTHCAKTAGMGLNSKVHVVCDGAAWIRTQSKNAFGDQATVLTDFYHVCDYLSQVNQSVESLPRGWFQTQKKRLRQGRVSALLKDLEQRLEAPNLSDENAPVRRAHRYLKNRLDALGYKQALEDELPIGSGLIESGHKHVLQSRMKISGASWKIEHAEIMVRARAFRANKQWNQYWKKAA